MNNAVLLDTSFLIRLLNDDNSLNANAEGYYKYFLENNIAMVVSTIAIAEYCVRGSYSDLPLKNIQVLPFNFTHALKTGEFAKVVFENKDKIKSKDRNIIPNDTKLFAQAEYENSINYIISSDLESQKIFNLLKERKLLNCHFIDLNMPFKEYFNQLF